MNARREIVVTGLGALNAAGIGTGTFWASVRDGKSHLSTISRFDPSGFPVQVAGEVAGFRATDVVPRRFVAKTDRFTHLVLTSADEALRDARLDLENEDTGRIGVWFGNNTGGWDLCEQGFDEYYTQGADVVNPWQATAWFLSAPQGFTTIRHGLRGVSKSFSGDRTSGASAFYFGMRSLQWGRNDVVLTGGCEAPVTPLSMLCFAGSGDLSRDPDPETAYRPFAADASGLVVGEGASGIVLEEAGRAAARGAVPHLRVLGGAHGTSPHGSGAEYAAVIGRALADAGRAAGDIDLVLCEGSGSTTGDGFEAEALRAALAPGTPVAVPKSMFGHLYGGAFGTDVVCAALAVRDGVVPPTWGVEPGADLPLALSSSPRERRIENVLVTSHSRYGSCVATVVAAP